DRRGQAHPVGALILELAAPFTSQCVEARVAAGLGGRPFGGDPPAFLEAMERGVQRTLLHLQYVARDLLEPLRHGIAVNGPERDDLEDEHVERALQQVGLRILRRRHTVAIYIATATQS